MLKQTCRSIPLDRAANKTIWGKGMYEYQELNPYSEKAHSLARSKGWYTPEPSIATVFNNFDSEVSEMHDEFAHGKSNFYYGEGDKPCGVGIEAIDLVIRICDTARWRGVDIDAIMRSEGVQKWVGASSLDTQTVIRQCHDWISIAHNIPQSRAEYLVACTMLIQRWCDSEGLAFMKLIELKHQFNEGREWRHGNKVV